MYQHYLVTVTIYIDGFEKNSQYLIFAPSDEDAEYFGCFLESHDKDNIIWDIEDVLDGNRSFTYTAESKVVEECDVSTLKKYLPCEDYSRKKLAYAGNYDEYFDEDYFEDDI